MLGGRCRTDTFEAAVRNDERDVYQQSSGAIEGRMPKFFLIYAPMPDRAS